MDQNYSPIYLDNPYQVRRSFDPDINIYSGRRGGIIILRQFFYKDTSIGYGYKNYSFAYNDIIPFLDGGRSIEHQIRLEEDYYKYFHLKVVYSYQHAEQATYSDGVTKINTVYVHVKSDFMDHVSLEIEFAKNLDYYENFDQLAIGLAIWGL